MLLLLLVEYLLSLLTVFCSLTEDLSAVPALSGSCEGGDGDAVVGERVQALDIQALTLGLRSFQLARRFLSKEQKHL